MAIIKKPTILSKDKLIDTIIEKGGSSPIYDEENKIYKKTRGIKVTIRLTKVMLDIIDNYLHDSISDKNRNQWVKEAIEEKIKKDILNDND